MRDLFPAGPEKPPPHWEDTRPIPYAVCDGCHVGKHTWSQPGLEQFDHTELRRYICVCTSCYGRCDGYLTAITPSVPPQGRRRQLRRRPPAD
jgi:hypothetical protein